MRTSLRRGGGTETARPLDPTRVARAIAAPDLDLRYWVSYGTVCTLNDDGSFNFEDGQAVFTSADGCFVDVLLHPAMQHVTARYAGVQGGAAGTIYTPIRPGDEVLVEIPGGDLRLPPVITRIMTAEHSRLPLGQDRKPRWQNDRILIHAATVPIEIRSENGGTSVQVNPDGKVIITASNVFIGGEDASAPIPLGDKLQTLLDAIHTHTHPVSGVLAGISADLQAIPDPQWKTESSFGKVK